MPELGHIAYYVRNLERSVAFYQRVIGLDVVGRIFRGRAAVLSGGRSHHELFLIQISTADGPLVGRRIGLYHTGWKVGNTFYDLQDALDRAHTYGAKIDGTADHGITFSLYLRDPDDNEVELFVDNPDYDWQQDKSWMEAPVKPLDLSISCLQRVPGPQSKPFLRQPQPRQPAPVSVKAASTVADKPAPDKPVLPEKIHQQPQPVKVNGSSLSVNSSNTVQQPKKTTDTVVEIPTKQPQVKKVKPEQKVSRCATNSVPVSVRKPVVPPATQKLKIEAQAPIKHIEQPLSVVNGSTASHIQATESVNLSSTSEASTNSSKVDSVKTNSGIVVKEREEGNAEIQAQTQLQREPNRDQPPIEHIAA